MVEQIRQDIRDFKAKNDCARIVVIWAASTEIYVPYYEPIHGKLDTLVAAMKADDREHIAPSMCYAYAALQEDAPFIMGAPNTTVDIPAMWQLAEEKKLSIAGKDFKTGQTLVKSGFAPILKVRNLGLSGWFSTNILGNRDGLVLDEPANDIFGWMGYPMQIKINFLCRDSILAAPLLLDLTLLSDLAHRAGRYGIQRFLSFFLKSPMHDYTKGEEAVNNLFEQYTMLKNAIRSMGGYEADEEVD